MQVLNTRSCSLALKLIAGSVLLIVAAMLTYRHTLQNDLVWDSTYYLVNNEPNISGLGWEHLKWMLFSQAASNWHPLTWLSWALDYQLYGGLNAWGFHLSNNLFHGINSALLFILMLAVLGIAGSGNPAAPLRRDRNALLAALLAALLFAVHPQHVESVAWVAERKDLLCQMFMLLTLLAYTRYVAGTGGRRYWYLAALLMFTMALMSKPMAVTLPVVLLLLDVYPLHRSNLLQEPRAGTAKLTLQRLVLEKIPFLLLSAASVLITLAAQKGAMAEVPFDVRFLNAFNSIIIYISKLLIPISFSPHYPFFINPLDGISWDAYLPLLTVLAVTAVAVFLWIKGRPAWLVCWLIYLVALSPVLGLVSVGAQGMADRYTYFPTLPFYFLGAVGILTILDTRPAQVRRVTVALVCVFALLLSLQAGRQTLIWRNELTLWNHAVLTYPDNPLARNNFGVALLIGGHYQQAIVQFDAIEQLPAQQTTMLAWRALSHMMLAHHEQALSDHLELAASAEHSPGLTVDLQCLEYNLGWLRAQLGLPQDAILHFQKVTPESAYFEPAQAWLAWLDDAGRNNDSPRDSGLPGSCQVLIPQLWQ